MPPATATTLKELVRSMAIAGPAISLLSGGVNGFFPRAGTSPDGSTPCPFMIAKFGGRGGGIASIHGWSFYVYDQHGRDYWRIEEIIRALDKTFVGKFLPPMKIGYTRYDTTRVVKASVSGELVDGGWDKNMMISRYSAMGL